MRELTERQREVYDFIRERIAMGLPPTRREMADHFSWSGPNSATDHLRALVQKGFVRIDPRNARSIRLLNGEPKRCPHCGGELGGK